MQQHGHHAEIHNSVARRENILLFKYNKSCLQKFFIDCRRAQIKLISVSLVRTSINAAFAKQIIANLTKINYHAKNYKDMWLRLWRIYNIGALSCVDSVQNKKCYVANTQKVSLLWGDDWKC